VLSESNIQLLPAPPLSLHVPSSPTHTITSPSSPITTAVRPTPGRGRSRILVRGQLSDCNSLSGSNYRKHYRKALFFKFRGARAPLDTFRSAPGSRGRWTVQLSLEIISSKVTELAALMACIANRSFSSPPIQCSHKRAR
jgi:hypothetical protein